jgi:hypothetical protein
MARTDLTKALLSRFERLSGQRQNWETHWQEVADYMMPRKSDVTKKDHVVIKEWNLSLIVLLYKP